MPISNRLKDEFMHSQNGPYRYKKLTIAEFQSRKQLEAQISTSASLIGHPNSVLIPSNAGKLHTKKALSRDPNRCF